jgi:hypothetical protein
VSAVLDRCHHQLFAPTWNETMNKRGMVFTGHALTSGAGVAVGVIAAFLVLSRTDRKAAPAPSVDTRVEVAAHSPEPGDALRIGNMEERLRALEARSSAAPPAPMASASSAAIAQSAPMSEDERAEHARQDHQRWVDRYQGEGADPSWAPSAARSISSELGRIGGKMGNATVVQTTCKTTMCAAELEWPTMEAAFKSGAGIVEHMYEMPCARELRHPPADDPSKPYRATLYFDCESSRAQGTSP